jgi:hypothetical protein
MSDLKAKTNRFYAKPAKFNADMHSVLSSKDRPNPPVRQGCLDNKKIPSLINGKVVEYKGSYIQTLL